MIWVGIYTLIFTVCPIVKYFSTYTWSRDMTFSIAFAGVLFYTACFVLFGTSLDGTLNSDYVLLLWFIMMWSPTGTLMAVALYKVRTPPAARGCLLAARRPASCRPRCARTRAPHPALRHAAPPAASGTTTTGGSPPS